MEAKKEDWKTSPIKNPREVPIDLEFTKEQYEKMKQGYLPETMDEKWFIYFEDDWLYFHRSWTGYGIFKAKLNKNQADGCSITSFFAEYEPGNFSCETEDEYRDYFRMVLEIVSVENY